MGYLDNLKGLLSTQAAGGISGPKKSGETQPAKRPEEAPKTLQSEPKFTVDSSELEIRAEMNKALGFVRTTPDTKTDFEKINAEFAKDPIAFAQKYATPELRSNATESTSDFYATLTVSENLSPERQEQVIAGFSQRNESPRAFTGEFLDLFSVA